MKRQLRQVRRHFNALAGRDYFETTDMTCSTRLIGNLGACWTVNPDFIDENSIIYSAGIGEDISFDLTLINDFNVTVHAFDPTPKSLAWLSRQSVPEKFQAHPVGLAGEDGTLTFHAPTNPEWVSYSLEDNGSDGEPVEVPVKTIKTLMRELNHSHIDILKMDIEGAEYGVIDSILDSNILPNMLLIEFHHRFAGHNIDQTKHAIAALRNVGYKVFHVSENGEEMSLCLVDQAGEQTDR